MTILPYPDGTLSRGGGSITVNADGSINVTPAGGKDIILQGGTSGAPIAIGNAAYRADTTGRVLTIDPVQTSVSDSFNIVASNTIFAPDPTRGDQVVMIGHNIAAGGVPFNAAHGAVWDSWEQYYAQDATHFYMERHMGVFSSPTTPGTQYRTFTMQFDLGLLKTTVDIIADSTSFLDMSSNQWFKFSPGNLQMFSTSIILHNTNNQPIVKQINAAGSQNIELMRLDSANNINFNTSQDANGIKFSAPKIGFYTSFGTAPVAKQTVTGSKGANAALTSLMAALVAIGLFTDTTT